MVVNLDCANCNCNESKRGQFEQWLIALTKLHLITDKTILMASYRGCTKLQPDFANFTC